MKIFYCSGCKIKVAEIPKSAGVMLKPGIEMICANCEQKRVALEMARKGAPGDLFNNLFGGFR